MKNFNLLKLEPIREDYPKVWLDIYDAEYKMPFLYHYYYRSGSEVRKYLQYYKRPEKALQLLNIDPNRKFSILDIGCDWGYLLMLIKSRYPEAHCWGVDIDRYSCEFGAKLARNNKLDVHLQYSNANNLAFPENTFDYVVSTGTFEHILPEWRSQALREIRRVLKPGGRVVILIPNPDGLAQRVKDALSNSFIAKHTMFLPNLKDNKRKRITLPHSSCKEDSISCTDSIGLEKFARLLQQHGFSIEHRGSFIFMVEFIPNWLMGPSVLLEKVLERLDVTKPRCTTLYFSAFKPSQECRIRQIKTKIVA